MKNLRLDPNNPKDRKLLEEKIDKKTGKPLMQLYLEGGKTNEKLTNINTNLLNPNESLNATRTNKKRRYNNKRTFADGQWFDSAFESRCWLDLKYLESLNIIYDLSRDKVDCRFEFHHNDVHIATARFDFAFTIRETERRIIADAKSPATEWFQRYRWQKNMMKAFYNLDVVTFLQGDMTVEQTVVLLIKNEL